VLPWKKKRALQQGKKILKHSATQICKTEKNKLNAERLLALLNPETEDGN